MYRFYVNDPVRFGKSIKVTIEHGHNNNFENDYTATAFWYQQDPHKAFPKMRLAKDRLPFWPEGLSQALEKEVGLKQQIRSPVSRGIELQEKDRVEWDKLEAARNKAFKELLYNDFIHDVNAMEEILKKYPQKKE